MASLDLIAIDDEILNAAARLKPLELRTLDAIHIATAQALGSALAGVISYDTRLVEGAKRAKVTAIEPR